jgi:hypothetical protein
LGKNHEKACRFGLHQLRNCSRQPLGSDFHRNKSQKRNSGTRMRQNNCRCAFSIPNEGKPKLVPEISYAKAKFPMASS